MDRVCGSCKKTIDAALVKCPFCGAIPTEEAEPKLTPGQIKLIRKRVKRELIRAVLLWAALASAILGLSVLQIYNGTINQMRTLLVERIGREFEQPAIRKTVQDVAATSAEHILKTEIGPEVSRFKSQMEQSLATITAKVTTATTLLEGLQAKSTVLDQRIRNNDETLKKAQQALSEIKLQSDLVILMLSAQGDDRKAFDKLRSLSQDKSYPLSELAFRAVQAIVDKYSPLGGGFVQIGGKGENIPWAKGVDPSKLTLADLRRDFELKGVRVDVKRDTLDFICSRTYFSKKDKMAFLIEVMQNDGSLSVVSWSIARFELLAGLPMLMSPHRVGEMLDWWRENKDKVQ
jgi:hypothetical protein